MSSTTSTANKLLYGDNLHVLRDHIADKSVDLIYLDPLFHSKRDYNFLFKTPKDIISGGDKSTLRWNPYFIGLSAQKA